MTYCRKFSFVQLLLGLSLYLKLAIAITIKKLVMIAFFESALSMTVIFIKVLFFDTKLRVLRQYLFAVYLHSKMVWFPNISGRWSKRRYDKMVNRTVIRGKSDYWFPTMEKIAKHLELFRTKVIFFALKYGDYSNK